MKKTTLMWVGGAALAAVLVGGVAYAMKKPPATPSNPAAGALTPATVFNTGKNYGIAAQVGANITTQAQLVSALNAAGWTNVQVQYFGPTGGAIPQGLPFTPPGAAATAYVASGTWNGADNTPVPTGVMAALIS
jgi:hypothetical protein